MIVENIRKLLRDAPIVEGRGGATKEILGASFIADEDSIFGCVNYSYIQRELEWYKSQSLSLHSFPGGAPKIWRDCADPLGVVNSNYGWCMYSEANGSQFSNVVAELYSNPSSRRACAIYNRPTMHVDATEHGRQDFMCTNAVEYFIRSDLLYCVVQMRSNDAVIGYRNDLAWHRYVLHQLAMSLQVDIGIIYWQVGSLHVYARDFHLLEQ